MKRFLVAALLYLLFGGSMNIAVAWVLALRVPIAAPMQTLVWEQWEQVDERRWRIRRTIVSHGLGRLVAAEHINSGGMTEDGGGRTALSEVDILSRLPRVSALHRGSSIRPDTAADAALSELYQPEYSYREFYSGWPLLALRYLEWTREVRFGPTSGVDRSMSGSSEVSGSLKPIVGAGNLPCQPIWRGMLANSVFFAAAAAALWLSFGFAATGVRSTCRRWRGRCVGCAYDLRGAKHERCPECGRIMRPGASAIRVGD